MSLLSSAVHPRADARLRSPWLVLPAAVALVLAGLVAWSPEANQQLFTLLNGLAVGAGASFWLFATLAGDTAVVLALLGALHGRYPLALRALPASLLLVSVLVHVPKPWFSAPRPLAVLGLGAVNVLGPPLLTQSFPSGHSATAFAAAALVTFAGASRGSAAVALVAATFVAVSRCVVGAHWPVDVAMGAALGWLGAWCAVLLTRKAPGRWAKWLHGLGLAIVVVAWLGVVSGQIKLLPERGADIGRTSRTM